MRYPLTYGWLILLTVSGSQATHINYFRLSPRQLELPLCGGVVISI
jgi:hypothetical protein